jgi:hypothetical protein
VEIIQKEHCNLKVGATTGQRLPFLTTGLTPSAFLEVARKDVVGEILHV